MARLAIVVPDALKCCNSMISFREDLLNPPPTLPLDQASMELAAKYACHGSRYTSYPTAIQFHQNFPREQYYHWQHSDGDHKTAPLSLHVHLPFSQDSHLTGAGDKTLTHDQNAARNYLCRLRAEIELQSELVGSSRSVTQMHWGGGTPSFLDHAEITELMHLLASHFRLLDKGYREYSIEIDPATTALDTIALLKGLGFNRLSLRIDDFDPLVQKSINHIQAHSLIASLVDCIRTHHFRSLSLELLYGLPHQDNCSMQETLRKVIALQPDRVSCHPYEHLPTRPGRSAIDHLNLPSTQEKLLLQGAISHRLQEAGYLHIGMDHYALPGDELAQAQQEGRLQRNFLGYSVQSADDLLGLGVSASSQIGDFYLQNELDLAAYYTRIDQGQHPAARGFRVSHEDKLRRFIIMSLICELKLDIPECSRRFGIEFASMFHTELLVMQKMEDDGLLCVDAQEIQVSPRGKFFLRNICGVFDAYVQPLEHASASDFPAEL